MDNTALLKNLMHASGNLWRIEKHHEDYGRFYWVTGADGCMLPFVEARQRALDAVEKALEAAGVIYCDAEPSLVRQP